MTSPGYLERDRGVWEHIFENMPRGWLEAEPSDTMRRCQRFFSERGAARVLDLGCGFGRWAAYLASDRRVVGLDYAIAGLRAAKGYVEAKGVSPEFVAGSAVSLPFRPASFDGVLAALLLDNLSREDMARALAELSRVTRPKSGGFFMFNPYLSDEELEKVSAGNPTRDCMHVVYRDEELAESLDGWSADAVRVSEEGFRIVEAHRS